MLCAAHHMQGSRMKTHIAPFKLPTILIVGVIHMRKRAYTVLLGTVTAVGLGLCVGGVFFVPLLPIGCTILGVAGPLALVDAKTSSCRKTLLSKCGDNNTEENSNSEEKKDSVHRNFTI